MGKISKDNSRREKVPVTFHVSMAAKPICIIHQWGLFCYTDTPGFAVRSTSQASFLNHEINSICITNRSRLFV